MFLGVDGVFARKGGGCVIVNLRLRDMVAIHMRLCAAATGQVKLRLTGRCCALIRRHRALPRANLGLQSLTLPFAMRAALYPARTRDFTRSDFYAPIISATPRELGISPIRRLA